MHILTTLSTIIQWRESFKVIRHDADVMNFNVLAIIRRFATAICRYWFQHVGNLTLLVKASFPIHAMLKSKQSAFGKLRLFSGCAIIEKKVTFSTSLKFTLSK